MQAGKSLCFTIATRARDAVGIWREETALLEGDGPSQDLDSAMGRSRVERTFVCSFTEH